MRLRRTRLSQVKDSYGTVKLTNTYDNTSRITQVADGLGKITTLTRDALGRVNKVTDANGNSVQTVLDSADQAVGFLDGLGNMTQEVYDAIGMHMLSIDPLGGRTEKEYDANGRLTAYTDPLGNRWAYEYNANGQLTKETDPFGKSRTYVFDDAGRLTTYTDRLGRVKEFAYFANGLLQTETWRNTAGGPAVNTKNFTYNENNQLLTAGDNFGTYTLTYDEHGRLKTQLDPFAITLTFNYDVANRLTSVVDSKGGTRTLGYDDANRLTSIQYQDASSQLRLNFVYNNRDFLTEIDRYTDAAGATLVSKTIFAHDDAGRVTSIAHKDAANATVDSFAYLYDAANRTTQETSTLGPTRNYSYDKTNQLTGTGSESFTFDANGNRTMSGYGTGTANRITTDGTWNYTFDDEGNLTQKTNIASGQVWLYSYNHNNQLTKVERKPNAGAAVDLRVELKYDVFGNRIEKSVDADGDGSGTAVVTKFAFEAGNAWADLNNAGSLTTRRIFAFGLDSLLARIGSSTNEDWYLSDKLGSIRELVSSTGALIDHIDYKAFGEVQTETQPANGDPYKFTGQEWDSEIELYLYGYRHLDPKVGKFNQNDPMGFAAGDPNLYRDVGNSPTNFTDPTGESRAIALGTMRQLLAMMQEIDPENGYIEVLEGQIQMGVDGTYPREPVGPPAPVASGSPGLSGAVAGLRECHEWQCCRARANGWPIREAPPSAAAIWWGAAGEGCGDGLVFMGNGATLGLIDPLNDLAQDRRRHYSDGVYWISTGCGGLVTACVAVGGAVYVVPAAYDFALVNTPAIHGIIHSRLTWGAGMGAMGASHAWEHGGNVPVAFGTNFLCGYAGAMGPRGGRNGPTARPGTRQPIGGNGVVLCDGAGATPAEIAA